MKIVTIVGARPQFVKAAVVSRALASHKDINEIIVHTGQHYDAIMSDIFFEQMSIPRPQYNLGVSGTSHGAMTGKMLSSIEEVLVKESPDKVMVYGDTNSTLAGALAASKIHIPVAHVEAGLRSFNMRMPEEVNRILTDRISAQLFCPTQTAVNNLIKEGFDNFESDLCLTGDVMEDAAIFYSSRSEKPQGPDELDLSSDYVLATIHRAENTDCKVRLKNIILSFNEIHSSKPVVLPVHPRTRNIINKLGITVNFHLIPPVGYLEMIWLIQNASIIMTDSGGLQKEAYFLSKPCVTLRDETEWVELIDSGANTLAGANSKIIMDSYSKMLTKDIDFSGGLYGGGNSAAKIVERLIE